MRKLRLSAFLCILSNAPQTWPRTKKRGHEVPVRLPRPALFRHIAQTLRQRPANFPRLSRDSHGGKRKNRVFCCRTRPGICISLGMIQALPRIKGGRFSSRHGKMELKKTLCSTTPPLIHHPFATPSPLFHPRSPTPPPTIGPVFINYPCYPTTQTPLSAVQKGTLLVVKCML